MSFAARKVAGSVLLIGRSISRTRKGKGGTVKTEVGAKAPTRLLASFREVLPLANEGVNNGDVKL